MDSRLGRLAAELECLSLELVNIEAQVSKIRAEMAELSKRWGGENGGLGDGGVGDGGVGDEGDLVPVPVITRPPGR